MTQRPCSASCAGLPGAGAAVVTTYSGTVDKARQDIKPLYPAADAAA